VDPEDGVAFDQARTPSHGFRKAREVLNGVFPPETLIAWRPVGTSQHQNLRGWELAIQDRSERHTAGLSDMQKDHSGSVVRRRFPVAAIQDRASHREGLTQKLA
jgi:hypothetical protein